MNNTRALAAQLCRDIIDQGKSLDQALSQALDPLNPEDRGFVQELVYGVCRWYGALDKISHSLIAKPLRNKDRDIHYLLLIGLYQLKFIHTADHAAISETVNGAKVLKKVWAVKLLNACLRRFQREQNADQTNDNALASLQSHPAWLIEAIKNDWPEHWQAILSANNDRPLMCLRVNSMRSTRSEYLARLTTAGIDAQEDPYTQHGINLKHPVPVSALPGFASGDCSVQDTAAQIASELLQPRPNTRILDCCAAPGGKLAHVLELTGNQAQVDAIDVAPIRVEKIRQGLARLNLTANIYTGDATDPNSWPASSKGYQQIIIDAPCSGTGVIRRHPDIRWLRKATDIENTVALQKVILAQIWQRLKPGGTLLYATCSILKQENEQQIAAFLATQADASLVPLHENDTPECPGLQILPGQAQMDGFYYARLLKS